MKIQIGIATFNSRFRSSCLLSTIRSLSNQDLPDGWEVKIAVYDNEVSDDLGALGKFKFVVDSDYYLTCDDDIIYAKDYVRKMVEAAQKYTVVSLHGRPLLRAGDYFCGQHTIKFHHQLTQIQELRVPGTGVMAVKSSFIDWPVDSWIAENLEHKRRADLLFGLKMMERRQLATCITRQKMWCVPQRVLGETCHRTGLSDSTTHNELAKIILEGWNNK